MIASGGTLPDDLIALCAGARCCTEGPALCLGLTLPKRLRRLDELESSAAIERSLRLRKRSHKYRLKCSQDFAPKPAKVRTFLPR